jgi:hypothetical protein
LGLAWVANNAANAGNGEGINGTVRTIDVKLPLPLVKRRKLGCGTELIVITRYASHPTESAVKRCPD